MSLPVFCFDHWAQGPAAAQFRRIRPARHLDIQDELWQHLGIQDEAQPMTDVIQGTLDMLILKSLSLAPMHGFGITKRIEQISKGVFKVNPGSLLLAFQRMERDGLIDAEWRATENNRRAKFYIITDKGRKRLNTETREWERRTAAIARLLEA
jgi:PadR family transcriptional regulator, regulatory protein PadR